MKTKTHKVVNAINWAFIAAAALLIVAGFFDEGGGAVSGLATVLALTGILWAPFVLIAAVWGFVLEWRLMKEEGSTWTGLLKTPSTYVFAFILYVLSLILFG